MDERKLKAVRRFLETESVLKDAQGAHDASQQMLDNEFRFSTDSITRAVVDGRLVEIIKGPRSTLRVHPIAGIFNVEGSGLDGRPTLDRNEGETQ